MNPVTFFKELFLGIAYALLLVIGTLLALGTILLLVVL